MSYASVRFIDNVLLSSVKFLEAGGMLLIGGVVGFMSGVLLMFFLLGLRTTEDRPVEATVSRGRSPASMDSGLLERMQCQQS
jgi:hypothetical protein